jgi:hypothetical protein
MPSTAPPPPPPPKLTAGQASTEISGEARKDGATVSMPEKGDVLTVTLKKKPSDATLAGMVTRYYALYSARRRALGESTTQYAVEIYDSTGKKVARNDQAGYWPGLVVAPAKPPSGPTGPIAITPSKGGIMSIKPGAPPAPTQSILIRPGVGKPGEGQSIPITISPSPATTGKTTGH